MKQIELFPSKEKSPSDEYSPGSISDYLVIATTRPGAIKTIERKANFFIGFSLTPGLKSMMSQNIS